MTRFRTLAIAAAIALSACASGRVIVRADGSCEVAGVALGRAELVAYRSNSAESRTITADDTENSSARELCAKVGGGSGSAGWWGALGAVAGVLAGIWL